MAITGWRNFRPLSGGDGGWTLGALRVWERRVRRADAETGLMYHSVLPARNPTLDRSQRRARKAAAQRLLDYVRSRSVGDGLPEMQSRGHSANHPQGQRLVERRVIHDDARKALARAACLVSLRSARGLH